MDNNFNKIKMIKSLPFTCSILNLSDNCLTEIKSFPRSLVKCVLSNNKIEKLPDQPVNLKVLNISNNPIKEINKISPLLNQFIFTYKGETIKIE